MIVNNIIKIIYILDCLDQRICTYAEPISLFGFLCELDNLSNEQISEISSRLSSFYQYDIDVNFSNEFIQFVEFVKLQRTKSESNILEIYKELISKEITVLFPNMCIIIRIYLTLMI